MLPCIFLKADDETTGRSSAANLHAFSIAPVDLTIGLHEPITTEEQLRMALNKAFKEFQFKSLDSSHTAALVSSVDEAKKTYRALCITMESGRYGLYSATFSLDSLQAMNTRAVYTDDPYMTTTDRSMITQVAFMWFEIRPTVNMVFR